jgi:hypothetical protein
MRRVALVVRLGREHRRDACATGGGFGGGVQGNRDCCCLRRRGEEGRGLDPGSGLELIPPDPPLEKGGILSPSPWPSPSRERGFF